MKISKLLVLTTVILLSGISGGKVQAKTASADLETKAADYYIIEEASKDKAGEVSAKLQKELEEVENPETVIIDKKEYMVTEVTGLCYPDTIDASLKQDTYKCKKNKVTTKIVLPKTIEKIGKGTFTNFSKLREIVIAEENPKFKSENGAVLSKSGKTLYGTITIKNTYRVPNGVVKISSRAFAYSSVKKVILPKTCKKIQERAFYRCKNLRSVKNLKKVKKIGSGAFYKTKIKNV